MQNKTCCFTGHRILPKKSTNEILEIMSREIERLRGKGVTNFMCGGALGFDTLASSLIIAKKIMGKDVRLILALPCKNQDLLWSNFQKKVYRNILEEADEIIYVSEEYDRQCMKRRNSYMVEHSEYCICALTNKKSGTGQTVRMAQKKGLEVFNVIQEIYSL